MLSKELCIEMSNSMILAIFLYKVTFEETKEFYWGIHLQRKEDDGYIGSPVTHAWKWDFYTPKLDVLHYFEPTEEGWNEARLVEDRVIRPDLNSPLCLNEHCGTGPSIESMRRGGRKSIRKLLDSLSPKQKSEKASRARLSRLDPEGRDLISSSTIRKQHLEEDESGKSKLSVMGAKAFHSKRDEKGRSIRILERHEDIDPSFGYSRFARMANSSRMRPVEVLDIKANVGFVFECVADAANFFGVSQGNLRATAIAGSGRKQTKGLKARFI